MARRLPKEHQVVRENSKYNRVLDRIGEWAQREGSLPSVIIAYDKLLRRQIEARGSISVPQPDLTKEAAFSQLSRGEPLLKFDDLPLDWSLVENLFRGCAGILVEHTSQEPTTATALEQIASDRSTLEQAARDWYQGQPLSSVAAEKGISDELLTATIQAALYPFLITYAEALSDVVNQGVWRQRICPICGGKPDFAFLDKERGGRWLLCSRCDTEWIFQRLQCPYCGTQGQKALKYFTNDQGLYRLYTCEQCRSYIKAIDLRKTQTEALLPLERILTAGLDRQAVEAGYKAG